MLFLGPRSPARFDRAADAFDLPNFPAHPAVILGIPANEKEGLHFGDDR